MEYSLFGDLVKRNTSSTSRWFLEKVVNAEIQRLKEEHYNSQLKVDQRNEILYSELNRMHEILRLIAEETESALIRRLVEETLRDE